MFVWLSVKTQRTVAVWTSLRGFLHGISTYIQQFTKNDITKQKSLTKSTKTYTISDKSKIDAILQGFSTTY